MGKPIKKKWFGPPIASGNQIIVDAVRFADGTLVGPAYIVKQTGDRAYIVSDGTKSEIAFLANAEPADLLPGQCRIAATPFGGAPRPCEKIAQYRLSLHEVDGTINDYTWSTIPAVKKGQADLDLG
jgi:hypothetical protein